MLPFEFAGGVYFCRPRRGQIWATTTSLHFPIGDDGLLGGHGPIFFPEAAEQWSSTAWA
jgi:hypothetical protein